MIIFMAASEEGQHGDAMWIKSGHIGRKIRIILKSQIESCGYVSLFGETPPNAGLTEPLKDELFILHPADHIEIYIADNVAETNQRMLREIGRADQSDFLARP